MGFLGPCVFRVCSVAGTVARCFGRNADDNVQLILTKCLEAANRLRAPRNIAATCDCFRMDSASFLFRLIDFTAGLSADGSEGNLLKCVYAWRMSGSL